MEIIPLAGLDGAHPGPISDLNKESQLAVSQVEQYQTTRSAGIWTVEQRI